MKVIKRNGKEVDFDGNKIIEAVKRANLEIPNEVNRLSLLQIQVIEEKVEKILRKLNHAPSIEEIQDLVIYGIMQQQAYEVAKVYTEYRFKHMLLRKDNTTDDSILTLVNFTNEELKQENSNKNPTIASTQRDYIAGEVSKDISMRLLLPMDIVEAHKQGIIHFHDADYFLQRINNCSVINLWDMLWNGTVISNVQITRPKSLATAANITTQIIAQVASNQYGGQTFSLAHLAPFVNISRQSWIKRMTDDLAALGVTLPADTIAELAEKELAREIKAAVKTIQYQLVTLMTTNGQTPFVSMFMCLEEARNDQERHDLALLIEEVLRQRIKGLPNEKGQWVVAAFPKLLYATSDLNIHKDSPYYYLTEMAAKCSAKTLVPDYISTKIMLEQKGDIYPCMGCRSFLTPDRFTETGIGNIANALDFVEGKHKYYGRFNQGVVTINLVDVACSSEKNMDTFWKLFDERLELCHRALRLRHERLLGTPSDIAPILWQHGAFARLKKGEKIDKLLYNGYSTLSLGYAGLYEMCMYMTGVSHTDPKGKDFAKSVMQHMNDKCTEWKKAENIDYSLYGTPLESTTYKFAKCLQDRFGVIPDVTEHNYITNSYHVNVREEIDAFTKLDFESEFQSLSPGGAISYVELPNMQNNIPAVVSLIEHIHNNIMYAEFNTKADFCQRCGYEGEIQIVNDIHGKLVWECPCCGNRDQDTMNVARRTCGYIGTQYWNQGRTQEIRDRVLHL